MVTVRMTTKRTTAARRMAQIASESVIAITRTFEAPRERVFKAWKDPERMKRWFGPKAFTTPVCKIAFHPGGVYHICMRSPDGRDYWCKGVYREIVQLTRIVCSNYFSDAEGRHLPATSHGMSASWPAETLVTVTFAEQAGKTKLSFRQTLGSAPANELELCRQGWSESFDKLAEELAKG